jgi:hypothetical protein
VLVRDTGFAKLEVQTYLGQRLNRQNEEFREIHEGFKIVATSDPDKLIFKDPAGEEVPLQRSEKPLNPR